MCGSVPRALVAERPGAASATEIINILKTLGQQFQFGLSFQRSGHKRPRDLRALFTGTTRDSIKNINNQAWDTGTDTNHAWHSYRELCTFQRHGGWPASTPFGGAPAPSHSSTTRIRLCPPHGKAIGSPHAHRTRNLWSCPGVICSGNTQRFRVYPPGHGGGVGKGGVALLWTSQPQGQQARSSHSQALRFVLEGQPSH